MKRKKQRHIQQPTAAALYAAMAGKAPTYPSGIVHTRWDALAGGGAERVRVTGH